ncbi:MAG: OmpA family protein [Myxococcota bacterium]
MPQQRRPIGGHKHIVPQNHFRFIHGLAACALLLSSACASTGHLTRKDVISNYQPIAQLDREVAVASSEGAALLAPTSFAEAQKNLDKAIDHAKDAESGKAIRSAEAGLTAMNAVNTSLKQSRDVLGEVLDTRDRATDAGAAVLFSERYNDAEKTLRNQAAAIERGEVADARDSLAKLVNIYSQLELDSLKKGTLEGARQAIKHAKENDADDYAPRTLKQAKQELKLLESIIDADRTQTDKADAHAKRTIWLARRADEITTLAKQFKKQELDDEGKILWYQNQLIQIREPLARDLPFDKPNAVVINVLRQDIQGLLASVDQMRNSQTHAQQRIAQLQNQMTEQRALQERRLSDALNDVSAGKEARIEALQKQLISQTSAQAEAKRRQEAAESRFANVQALINSDQGEVLRKGDDVILRLSGFYFHPGKSTIEVQNFGLLNNVVAAINTFPNSKIKVTGHTDARGGDELNQKLSRNGP